MMDSFSRLLAVLLVIFSTANLQVKSDNITAENVIPCTTPVNTTGQCVPIEQCRNIYRIVRTDLTTGMANYIKRATCALANSNRRFCCEPEEIVTNLLPMDDCGPMAEDRIANGNAAKVFDYTWMVVLRYTNGTHTEDGCAGTLINKRYVLTVAHCINIPGSFKLVDVRLGEHTKSEDPDCNIDRDDNGEETDRDCADPSEVHEIESRIVHPNYKDSAHGNDIALLRLKKDVVMKYHIKPICLPVTPELRSLQLKTFTVTGWGLTENQTTSDVLMRADLPRVNNTNCQQIYSKIKRGIFINDEKQICAGGQNKVDSCVGDSGGPLGFSAVYYDVTRFVQFGIVSFGINSCGEKSVPGIYTRVSRYMDWILDNIQS